MENVVDRKRKTAKTKNCENPKKRFRATPASEQQHTVGLVVLKKLIEARRGDELLKILSYLEGKILPIVTENLSFSKTRC